MTSPRMRWARALSWLVPLAWGCGGGGGAAYYPAEEPSPVVCSGGARLVNNECFCAVGTAWDGTVCVGTPQQGTCAQPGSMQVLEMCFCPDGFGWTDQAMSACAPLNCTGGAVASVNECVCAEGYAWIDDLCQRNCIPGAVRTDADTCVCPEGTEPQGDVDGCQPIAVAGPTEAPEPVAGPTEVPDPAPQPVQVRQRTTIQHTTQSFNCCINGSNYTCPSQDAFIQCGSGNTSLCTPAGRC